MKYAKLQRKMIGITLLVSLAPLLLLGSTIYYHFSEVYKDRTREQILYRARSQSNAVDLFLKERAAILSAMADAHAFNEINDEKRLSQIFHIMNTRAGAFVDLGVIDNAGQHLSYVGPYELEGLNYYQQDWFGEVMSKGIYISDVYTGYRQLPHFIIAVRRQEGQKNWILRATIDPDIFSSIVRAAQVGKTGDAFIINREGIYQTRPRFGGEILYRSGLDPSGFGGTETVIERKNDRGNRVLYAGKWLRDGRWLLVISHEVSEEMTSLTTTQNVEIAIIALGVLAIIFTTVVTTSGTIRRLKQADTEMHQLNAELVHSDKLAALGKMAASVAHEINNPLAVILQKTGWMEDLLMEEDPRKVKNFGEYENTLRIINDYVDRMKKVVHNMLGYARKMEPHLERVDINDTLNRTVQLLDNYARVNNIEITKDLAANLPITGSSQSELQQVFFNLISNAIDAIGKDGQVTIRSKLENSWINVNIIDDGPGIPDEKQKKLFEPFFTTKAEGRGTGLGLWVSYNIMKNLGGNITFTSKAGKGTDFKVQIPIVLPENK
jgi:two-component system NtrC family sensor kinase